MWHVRTTKPAESKWYEIDGSSLADAISSWHCANVGGDRAYDIPRLKYVNDTAEGGKEEIYFSLVEIEGEAEPLVARTFQRRIYRKGGVKPHPQFENGLRVGSLEWIAKQLGWTHSFEELLAPWGDGEETWEAANKRRSA